MSQDFIEFHLYKYPFLQHIYKKRRVARYGYFKNESAHNAYLRKKNSRLLRRVLLSEDTDAKNFFDWIWSIQENLDWSNRKFADEIGVTLQTLKLWRNFHGHFPSRKSLQKLLKLDQIVLHSKITKATYGMTTSRMILK